MKTIQAVINELITWGKEYGLKFNPDKTVVVIFHKRQIKEIQMPDKLVMGGKGIEFSTTMKYLGVTLDEKLTWRSHLDNVLKTCKSNLMYTSSIIRK